MNLSRNVTKRSIDETTIHEETFPAAEKILSDIENVLKKDPQLKSFEIIPIQDSENKSPVYHEEHSLGLASWCIQPLYCYAYGRIVDQRRCENRREESSTISRWLMGALLLNPDITTFWNMRRELVRAGRLDALDEFRFAALVLHHKAKCLEAFAYRRWLIQYLLVDGKITRQEMKIVLRNEISVAGITADRYANNYHAWSHREYVVSCYEKHMPDDYSAMIKSEWEISGKWCNRHVSDYSGQAYRQFLLNRLLYEEPGKSTSAIRFDRNELAERREFVERLIATISPIHENDETFDAESLEFLNILHGTKVPKRPDIDYDRVLVALSYWAEDCKSNENDILCYPGHEALWYHRRYLGNTLACLENSYKRHRPYECNVIGMTKCSKRDFHSIAIEDIGEYTDKAAMKDAGLLSIVFHRDNARIVNTAWSSMHEQQKLLSEKFVKYTREFSCDVANDEESMR